jgi:hypothetical protein
VATVAKGSGRLPSGMYRLLQHCDARSRGSLHHGARVCILRTHVEA